MRQMDNKKLAVNIRRVERKDVPFILQMIRELAEYEHSSDKVIATEDSLEKWLFDEVKAECLIASLDGIDYGFALFYTSFSTWTGTPCLYLEDLFVQKTARGCGLGLALVKELARITLERGYMRLEWSCLNWNEPSLKFYKSLGATTSSEWIDHTLDPAAMKALLGED